MRKTYIIAEIGNTHEGSLGLAKQFIKAAAACGVDAVKLQTHIFDAESLPNAPNPPYFKSETRKEYFERTAFNLEQYKNLKNFAEIECGIDFLSSPFSHEAVDLLLEAGISTFKIPSGEVNNIPLLEYIAKTKSKVILSSGMSTWKELDEAVEILKNNELIVLQCTSEYPCKPENAGLNVMEEIAQRYNCKVGFSDHTIGCAIPIAAVVKGACLIEKHFTLSKLMYGSDAANSTEPDEFKFLVDSIRQVEIAINTNVDKTQKVNELKEMKAIFEKSIVFKAALKAGETIEEKHLAYKKPGTGIPASEYKYFIGRTLVRDVFENEILMYNHVL